MLIVLIVLIVLSAILVIALGGVTAAGAYLVNYALAVDTDGRLGSMGDEPYDGVQDTQAQRVFDAWARTATIENWEVESCDGLTLAARFYAAQVPSELYVLAVHGYTKDHRDIEPAILPFIQRGFNVLAIDQRGRGESDGNFVSMGYFEKTDVVRWAQKIADEAPSARVVLYGESMGGATVLQAAGEQLPPQVAAVIEDCGYTTAYQMFSEQLKERFRLPAFPFLPVADVVSRLRFGFTFRDADALGALKRATLPILFIHGDADDYVPSSMGRQLYEAYQGEKQLLIVPGAGHGESSDTDPASYYSTVFGFLAKVGMPAP